MIGLDANAQQVAAGAGGLADHLIREHATEAGCDAVVTFDATLLALPGFRAP